MATGFYAVAHNVLTHEQRTQLVAGITQSEFYGPSALGEEFVQTYGFSVVFCRRALGVIHQELPFIATLLHSALFESCNAFYVNSLVLTSNSRVDSHVDCRLIPATDIRIIPNLVSVYYAEVSPQMSGGRLILNPDTTNEVAILPESGDLVHFVGSVIHRVEAVTAVCRRVSVVCEQYCLDDKALSAFPVCEIITGGSPFQRLNAMN